WCQQRQLAAPFMFSLISSADRARQCPWPERVDSGHQIVLNNRSGCAQLKEQDTGILKMLELSGRGLGTVVTEAAQESIWVQRLRNGWIGQDDGGLDLAVGERSTMS